MLRRFRPFRSTWSLVVVLGAVLFTLAACNEHPTEADTPPPADCSYNPTTHVCT